MPSGFPLRAPPARWYTGRARPADDRQPHARRAASLHGRGHTSPLELVSSSCTRAGDTHGGRATVATAQRICTLGSKKAARWSGASTQANGPTTPPEGREWSLYDCDGACTIREYIVSRIMQDVKPPACKIGPLALAFHIPAAAVTVKAGRAARARSFQPLQEPKPMVQAIPGHSQRAGGVLRPWGPAVRGPLPPARRRSGPPATESAPASGRGAPADRRAGGGPAR